MAIDHRKLRYGSSSALATLALVGAFVLVNVIAQKHFRRWDWTGSKIYSLSDKTVKLLQGLKADVELEVLIQPGAEMYEEIRELLSNYAAESSRLKIEFLDPASQPARVEQILKKFGIDPRGDTTAVVFSSGERHKHVSIGELADYDMSAAGMGGPPRVKSFKGESAFTSAMLSVTESKQAVVCFLKGHGEVSEDEARASGPSGFSQIKKELQRENFRIETTDVLGKSPLPAECDLLVLGGPTRGFPPPEAKALGDFIDGGGRLLAMIDPPFSREGTLQKLGIEQVFQDRGITLGDDIVWDPSQKLLFRTAESFAASDFPFHEITKDLRDPVVFGLARSMTPAQSAAGWTNSPIVQTSAQGWGERDLQHLDQISKSPADLQGPVSVVVAAEKKAGGDKTARIVAIGDSDLAQNEFLGALANLDLILNSVHWLIGKTEQIGIAAREPEQVQLSMTGTQERGVILITLLAMPGLAVGAGVVVWLFRRR